MKIAIIGGCIGGLCAAVTLQKQGHEVHVFQPVGVGTRNDTEYGPRDWATQFSPRPLTATRNVFSYSSHQNYLHAIEVFV